tara:strand:+ start:970 stop:1881 length:912 start_codon:yes stop_codon:yes gene_type:complete
MILITGADGFIGKSIAYYLSKKNFKVLKAIRRFRNTSDTIKLDLNEPKDIENACKKIDTIIHLAGLNRDQCDENKKKAFLINTTGTKNLLKQAIKEKIKTFIFFSTIHVYGKDLKGVITENHKTIPFDNYAKSNLIAEQHCIEMAKNSEISLIIFRVSNVIGLADIEKDSYWKLVANNFCLQAVKNKEIKIKNDGLDKRDFISINSIEQLIENVVSLKEKKINTNIFNIGSGITISIKDLAHLVKDEYLKLFRKPIKINYGNIKSENSNFQFNTDKIIKSELILNSHDIRDNIRDILIFCNKL